MGGINRQMIENITSYLTGHVQVHQQGYHDDPTLDLAFAAGGIATPCGHRRGRGDRAASRARRSPAARTRPAGCWWSAWTRCASASDDTGRAVTRNVISTADDPSGIVLGSRVAEILRVAVDDEVTLVTQAADGSIGADHYRVRGVYTSGIDLIDGVYVFLTLPAAQELFVLEGRVTTLAVRLAELDHLPAAREALTRELGPGYEVLGWERLMPALADNVKFHELLTYIILFVVFVVVTLGLANTILMGVMERTHEFGVMLALGTAPGKIARVVLYEALLLGLAGVALGDALGAGVVAWFGGRGLDMSQYAKAVQMMPGLTGIVYPRIGGGELSLLSALVLVTTVVASVYPAWKAAGFTPVGAIRGARSAWPAAAPPAIASPFPVRAVFARIALRGLARNPRRTALTSVAGRRWQPIFLGALSQGFFLQMRQRHRLVTGHVQIEVKGFRDELDAKLTLANSAELRACEPTVAAAAPRLQAMAMMSSPTQSKPVLYEWTGGERTVTRLHRQCVKGTIFVRQSRDGHRAQTFRAARRAPGGRSWSSSRPRTARSVRRRCA